MSNVPYIVPKIPMDPCIVPDNPKFYYIYFAQSLSQPNGKIIQNLVFKIWNLLSSCECPKLENILMLHPRKKKRGFDS
jgi:hypothetical protein